MYYKTRESAKKNYRGGDYEVTKKLFKEVKVLFTTLQQVNLEMLCTVCCHN
jgi:hypothetical protein